MALLLPFAVQFTHSLEKHEHHCNVNDIHVDEHEIDCSIFHFKINQNSINFPADLAVLKTNISERSLYSFEAQLTSFQYYNKPSRAPPTLLF